MTQSQIVASTVRAATCTFMRRSPTLLLLAIVVGAFLFVGNH